MPTRHLYLRIAVVLAALMSLPAAATENAREADSFVDSIGVDTHLNYPDTAYNNYTNIVKPMLNNLGVRHIRDGLTTSDVNYSTYIAELGDLATNSVYPLNTNFTSYCVKSSLIVSPTDAVPIATAIPKSLEAVEGPNETDTSGTFTFPSGVRSYQDALYQAITTNAPTATMPVLAPSLVNGGSYGSLGLVDCTGGNMHSYPSGQLPDANLDADCGLAPLVCGNSAPLYATETGYYTYEDHAQGISTTAQAKYVPRLFLEYFRRGIQRTYSYELLDEWSGSNTKLNNLTPESHFGLVSVSTNGWSATPTVKPAYTALQNLIYILNDPGTAFTPGSLNYTLTGSNPNALRHVLLQKRDGSFWLVLWQNVSDFSTGSYTDLSPSPQTATITFNQAVTSVTTYLPNTSRYSQGTVSNPTIVTGTITDVPLILQISGVSASTATSIPASVSMFGAAEGMFTAVFPYASTIYFNVDYGDNKCGAETSTTQSLRSVTKYDLPPLPAGKTVGSVAYGFYVKPGVAPTTDMDIAAYESAQSNIRDIDWNDPTNPTVTDLGTVLTPTVATGSFNVTGTVTTNLAEAIRQAYSDGQNAISLRTQLAGGGYTTGTGPAAYYDIASSKSSNPPSLVLKLVNQFTDNLASGTNITINTPANLTASYGTAGMSLYNVASVGSEWYWSQGGGASWNNSNNTAFPLAPASGENKLLITIQSMTLGSTLEVGGFYFNGTSLVSGTNQILGETNGLTITSTSTTTFPQTYELDMNAAATAAGISGATGWKADFWYSDGGTVGQTAVISQLSTSP